MMLTDPGASYHGRWHAPWPAGSAAWDAADAAWEAEWGGIAPRWAAWPQAASPGRRARIAAADVRGSGDESRHGGEYPREGRWPVDHSIAAGARGRGQSIAAPAKTVQSPTRSSLVVPPRASGIAQEQQMSGDVALGEAARGVRVSSSAADAVACLAPPVVEWRRSVGSAGHSEGLCKRCAFHAKGRCRNGDDCTHCHLEHEHRRRSRRGRSVRASEGTAPVHAGLGGEVEVEEVQPEVGPVLPIGLRFDETLVFGTAVLPTFMLESEPLSSRDAEPVALQPEPSAAPGTPAGEAARPEQPERIPAGLAVEERQRRVGASAEVDTADSAPAFGEATSDDGISGTSAATQAISATNAAVEAAIGVPCKADAGTSVNTEVAKALLGAKAWVTGVQQGHPSLGEATLRVMVGTDVRLGKLSAPGCNKDDSDAGAEASSVRTTCHAVTSHDLAETETAYPGTSAGVSEADDESEPTSSSVSDCESSSPPPPVVLDCTVSLPRLAKRPLPPVMRPNLPPTLDGALQKEATYAGGAQCLEVSATSWAAHRRAQRAQRAASATFAARDDGDASPEQIGKSMRSILNKLTAERFESLCAQVLQLPLKTQEQLAAVVAEIFERATTEKFFICIYAELCTRLDSHLALAGGDVGGKAFRRAIVTECQRSFERYLKPADNVRRQGLSYEDEYEEEVKLKTRMLGNMRFVGELLVRRLLAGRVLVAVSDELLSAGGEAELESLAVLLTVVGPRFEQPHSVYAGSLKDTFAALRCKAKALSVPLRVRCLLKDLLEARERGWTPKGATQAK